MPPNTAYTPKKNRITMLPAPTNLFVKSPSTGTTNLTWSNNASNDGEVVVQRSFDLLNWFDTVLSAAATSTSHNDLLTGQHVYYRVFAQRADRFGAVDHARCHRGVRAAALTRCSSRS